MIEVNLRMEGDVDMGTTAGEDGRDGFSDAEVKKFLKKDKSF